ncbi:MAG: LytR C-terminal domain-containing protein [Dietzia sp.]
MSSQSENPQHAPQPGDPDHGDPRYDDAPYGDPREGDAHGDPYGPGAGGPDEPSGPPYRAIAMVLLSAVVLAVGIGLVQLFGGDDDEAATTAGEGTSQVEPNGQDGQDASGQPAQGEAGAAGDAPAEGGAPAGQDGAQGAPGQDGQPADPAAPGQPGDQAPAGQPAGAGPDVTAVPVQIFNNSTVTGLAGRTGEALRERGFAVGDVANMPSNRGVVAQSTAFFGSGPGEREAAEAIAAQLGITAKPRPADLAGEAPGVIVIVTQDLDR